MLKHLKSTLASLLAAALLVSALAVPVAADTGCQGCGKGIIISGKIRGKMKAR